MKQSQNLRQDLRLQNRITQQQLRYVRLLELNASELDEAVDVELEANPALEEENDTDSQSAPLRDDDKDIPYYRLRDNNQTPGDQHMEFVAADMGESLYEHLNTQLDQLRLPPVELAAARYAAWSIDPNGYLRRTAQALADDMLFNTGEDPGTDVMHRAIDVIKTLDPAGVGAADLRESLILQLMRKPESETRNLALSILNDRFDEFSLKHYDKLRRSLHVDEAELRKAIDAILQLNPKPGAAYDQDNLSTVSKAMIPDFIIDVADDDITIELANSHDDLRVVESFRNAMARMEREKRRRGDKEREFIRTCYTDARDFITILRRRRETLFAVISAIVKIQREYIISGNEHDLKPMGLKDIAELTGMDLSVISRATNDKYVSLPWGVKPLRFFFSEAFTTNSGATTSGRGAEAAIRALVEQEDKQHPLSDEALRIALEEQGYTLSRRTVAKYRDRIGIPVWRLRKE